MKIKIISKLPVEEKYRPPIGSIHEVVAESEGRGKLYYIEYNGKRVGVYAHSKYGECEVIKEDE